MTRLAVLVSGGGSNLQAILDSPLRAKVAVVAADRDCPALGRASRLDVTTVLLPPQPGEKRAVYDARLRDALEPYRPDLVVLAGWMRLLSLTFLERYRTLNLHPALPGELPGMHAIERAYAAFRNGGPARTGVMVHWVPDEGIDSGPTLGVEEVPIHPHDTLQALSARIHAAEHRLLVATLLGLASL